MAVLRDLIARVEQLAELLGPNVFLQAVIIAAIFIVAGKIADWIISGIIGRFASKSDNEFDDRLVLMATGDEIALDFDAGALPALAPDRARTFVLHSHAYCKGMDLYTEHRDSVEPLPFRAMSGYPYPAG